METQWLLHQGRSRHRSHQASFSFCLLGKRWYIGCRLYGKRYSHHGKVLLCSSRQTETATGLQSLRRDKLPKEILFFKTMLLLTRSPLRTRNWQLFTSQFWNTRPTHLIHLLPTTISFLTSRNRSRKESFRVLMGPHYLRTGWLAAQKKNFLGKIKELRTTK
jgi:hypothetical protein